MMVMMKNINITMLVLAILSVLISTIGHVSSAPAPPPPPPTKPHSILALQWPITVCAISQGACEKRKDPIPESFTLHGWWPTDPTWATSLVSCTQDPFSYSRIKDIVGLNAYWSNYTNTPLKDFWKHEWGTHGTCSGLSIDDYFKKALGFRAGKSSKILLALSKVAGIIPGKSGTAQIIRDAIEKEMGLLTQVKCAPQVGDKFLLQEIRFCMDGTYNFQSCTGTSWNVGCGNPSRSRITIPTGFKPASTKRQID